MYLHHLLGIREGRQRHNLSIGVDVKVQCLTKNKAYEISFVLDDSAYQKHTQTNHMIG